MNNLTQCKVCGKEIAANAKTCPECGAKNKKPIYKKWWVWVIAAFIIVGSMSMNGNDTKNNTPTNNAAQNSVTDTATEEQNNTTVPTTDETVQDTDNIDKEESVPEIPMEYKSALKKADLYSSTMHMSKQGIYDQLTSEYGEKFSPEAAQYAINNVQADWNENALKKAETYQKTMSMSPAKIHDQLTSEYGEKFTQEEADYAIANLPK